MSFRGSFCTEYVYCRKCFDVLRKHLVRDEKHMRGVVVPGVGGESELPIIAGKISGTYSGGELDAWVFDIVAGFQTQLCHPVRIAVIPESSEGKILVIGPDSVGSES